MLSIRAAEHCRRRLLLTFLFFSFFLFKRERENEGKK